MITNPNTLGLWDENIRDAVNVVHEAGGLVYNDGANFNAILGMVRPGDLGIDIMHFNLHKTFSTPHGGGGPGSGPVGVRSGLEEFLPGPIVEQVEEAYRWKKPAQSVGRLHGFHGNHGMHVRAYNYIRMHGEDGLRSVSQDAVLAANYLLVNLRDRYHLAYDRTCMHEFVLSAVRQKALGVRTLDIAKRLLDFWRASADDILSADRARGPHDRAYRDGVEGDTRLLHQRPCSRSPTKPSRIRRW